MLFVSLQITDERDPYFLYYMHVTEQNFHQLKRDQAILVELNVFPLKLIELLELCLYNPANASIIADGSFDSANNFTSIARPSQSISCAPQMVLNHGSSFENSVFNGKLDLSTGQFSIIESNMFKQLTHINLQFAAGNDESIKFYLSSRLKFTLDYARRQASEILSLQNGIDSEKDTNERLMAELNELR